MHHCNIFVTARPPYCKFLGSKFERAGAHSDSSAWRTKRDGGCPNHADIFLICYYYNAKEMIMPGDFAASAGKTKTGRRRRRRRLPATSTSKGFYTTFGATTLKPILLYYYYYCARTSNAPTSLTSWGYGGHATRLDGRHTLITYPLQ